MFAGCRTELMCTVAVDARSGEREWDKGKVAPTRDIDPRLARDRPPDAREEQLIEYVASRCAIW